MKGNNAVSGKFDRLSRRVKVFRLFRPKMAAEEAGAGAAAAGQRFRKSEFKELLSNALQFDIGVLLRLRTFVYLLAGTGLFLFQTYNTLAIINLALQNEKLREQIKMTTSVITSQELKVHELHSIHNIAQNAVSLGLTISSAPPVEIDP